MVGPRTTWIVAGLSLCLLWLALGQVAHAANIFINNLDGPGEGFNDSTPTTPVGGNPGTTLGQQRLNVFQRAAEIWGGAIESPVPIIVDANLDPLTCSASSGTLGAAGPTEVYRDFPGAPVANTWYHVALANAIVGTDLSGSTSDIVATFNSDIDNNNNCLSNTNWYLGLDSNPGAGISLLVVLLHEFAHGLGFAGFVNLETGAFLDGRADGFARNTLDLSRNRTWPQMFNNRHRRNSAINTGNVVWNGSIVTTEAGRLLATGFAGGGKVRLFTPNPLEPGSSVYHYDTVASPNLLMEPNLSFNQGTGLDLSDELLLDMGWVRRDTDGDGLSNTDEAEELGTNPNSVDTDNDGLTDGDGVVPVAAYPGGVDGDSDGFVDGENETGTDPNDADSDDDGINDGAERAGGTDPNDAAPEVLILSPASGSSFPSSQTIIFSGTAIDDEDGNLSTVIQWSSDKDGDLGTGASVSVSLSMNTHLITAAASDSAGAESTTSISLTVSGIPGDINADGLVDVADLLLLHQALTGTISLSVTEKERADTHPTGGNDVLDVGDLLALQALLTAP
ncbi:MAG: hypothetical protein ACR2QB_00340 [Gammaproteobacteria bacterium]